MEFTALYLETFYSRSKLTVREGSTAGSPAILELDSSSSYGPTPHNPATVTSCGAYSHLSLATPSTTDDYQDSYSPLFYVRLTAVPVVTSAACPPPNFFYLTAACGSGADAPLTVNLAEYDGMALSPMAYLSINRYINCNAVVYSGDSSKVRSAGSLCHCPFANTTRNTSTASVLNCSFPLRTPRLAGVTGRPAAAYSGVVDVQQGRCPAPRRRNIDVAAAGHGVPVQQLDDKLNALHLLWAVHVPAAAAHATAAVVVIQLLSRLPG